MKRSMTHQELTTLNLASHENLIRRKWNILGKCMQKVALKVSNSLWIRYKSLKNTNTSTVLYDHICIFVNTSKGSLCSH